ncbi:MAG TPA: trehalose-6-phosphate synthase [Streptosporangiaceae bacterium]|nr:trehalose-6-phosphate synthase [Streptosporangiaceae bacterium]
MNQRVLVASNRGPISYQFGADGSLTGRRGGGGMIAGVTDGLAALGPGFSATWICAALSDADRVVARRGGGDLDEGLRADIPVRMLDIPPGIFGRAYNNVANSALWFLLHQLFDTPNQPQFGAGFRRDWEAYVTYNEMFADALAQESRAPEPGAKQAGAHEGGQDRPASRDLRILVQDYHLCLVPRLLRERLGDAARGAGVGYFCHTPWAPPDYYRMLPADTARALLDGILGADRAGFHAGRWATAFMDCCAALLGADVVRADVERAHVERGGAGRDGAGRGGSTAGWVTYRGHVTEVAVHPLGVDASALRERARAGDVQAHAGILRQAAGGRKLIVRVDRTELSKNIVRGLAAYRELLTTRPQWRGRVVHLAFAYPSRSDLAEYRAYTERMRQLALEITGEFGTADWNPLILEVKDDYPRSLAACALADVLLVNPIRDGMNLVAQEGPVLSERGCALVLSREAGAAATLADDALLVNPYDITETAEALHQALAMPEAERQRRSAALAATAAADPPARWLGDQLASLGS